MITIFFSVFAHGGGSQTSYDKGGMPRCILAPTGDEILLMWNESERFERQVTGVRVSDIPLAEQDKRILHCNSWGILASKVPYGLAEVISVEKNPFALEIDKDNLERISQVRRGGTVYRKEATAEEFLADHPGLKFNQQANRKLTTQYGVGFVNDIYRSLVNAKPLNQGFQKIIHAKIDLETAGKLPPLGERFKGYTFLLVSGFMQSPTNDRLAPIQDILKNQGLEAIMAKINPVGGMVENTTLVKNQLVALLDQGKNLIVMAGSKGGPELMAALSELHDRLDSKGKGSVKAFASLSSVLEGSFIIDWSLKLPQRLITIKEMEKESKIMGLQWEEDGLRSMTADEVDPFLNRYVVGHLPQSLAYFGIMGVPGGNGLIADHDISILQNSIVRPHLTGFGANDGYVEFPGTSLSEKIIPNAYEVVFDSSHIILDGHYEKYDMSQEDQRVFVLNAVFEAMADVAGI